MVKNPSTAERYAHLIDDKGRWIVRGDVWIWHLGRTGGLTAGFGAKNDRIRSPSTTLMFTDTAFVGSALIEYSFAEPRFFPTFGGRPDPSIHFRHNGRKANVAWCDGHVDSRVMTFSWTSGLYQGDPELENVGWFGEPDDNGYFDLE